MRRIASLFHICYHHCYTHIISRTFCRSHIIIKTRRKWIVTNAVISPDIRVISSWISDPDIRVVQIHLSHLCMCLPSDPRIELVWAQNQSEWDFTRNMELVSHDIEGDSPSVPGWLERTPYSPWTHWENEAQARLLLQARLTSYRYAARRWCYVFFCRVCICLSSLLNWFWFWSSLLNWHDWIGFELN